MLNGFKSRKRLGAKFARVREQPLLFDDLNCGQRGRRADRAFFVCVVAERPVGQHIQVLAHEHARHGHHSAAEPFADHEHIRHNLQMFATKHLAGAA